MNFFFTVCNRTELPKALALSSSIKQHHPDSRFIIGWVDDIPVPILPEDIEILSVLQLPIPDIQSFFNRYYSFELVAACRPWFAQYILNTNSACKVLVFLAPTTYLYQPCPFTDMGDVALFLTPQLTKPLPYSPLLDDKRILNTGMYHAGSWIVKKSSETSSFLAWWSSRTLDRGFFNLCNGMCLDQLWLNYAPQWVTSTRIIQHPGWHLGLHSLLNVKLAAQNSVYTVEQEPLLSADFAGIVSYHPVWSDHQQLVRGNTLFRELLTGYESVLREFRTYALKGNPGLGKTAHIKSLRNSRKSIIKKLNKVILQIDQFSIKSSS